MKKLNQYPPKVAERIQRPNAAQAVLQCDCPYWGSCECAKSASLWNFEDTRAESLTPAKFQKR